MSKQLSTNQEYQQWLKEIKTKVRNSQIKAVVLVNQELLLLYWEIGKMIVDKQEQASWGSAVVEQLSKDLRREFPEMKGFSGRNLFYMKQWFQFYFLSERKLPQAVAQIKSDEIPQFVTQIPWGHNRVILNKIKDIEEALFYIHKCIENNWSRSVLEHQIESGLFQRQGKAIHNFEKTLPAPQSDLAQQMLKDPYVFDFMSIKGKADERSIEEQLTRHITEFLLELGTGFAFVGRQVHLEVGEDDFYIDLLFYHLRLRCYVVIELKAVAFKPEFAGKLNFYLAAVDDKLKTEHDQLTIGLMLCKTKDEIVAEYALKNINSPIGVAEYELSRAIPDNLKSELPSIEELEEELNKDVS